MRRTREDIGMSAPKCAKPEHEMKARKDLRSLYLRLSLCTFLLFSATHAVAAEPTLDIKDIISEALRNNRDLLAAESRWKAATFRISQAESLPDPMVMIGYQNEGWDRYTFGEMRGAMWMYSVSQMFPFPGKRSLKGEVAARNAEAEEASYQSLRLTTEARVREIYYDLFLAYKDIDLIRERTALFSRIEEAALARYSTGLAPQQEVLMAQTEKYVLLEREETLRQKKRSLEAMLSAYLGRDGSTVLGRPAEPVQSAYPYSEEELIARANMRSPNVREKEEMMASAAAGVRLARKEYYPDLTLTAGVFKRSGPFEDMWSLTAAFNIPLYFGSHQRQALYEAKSLSAGAARDLQATMLTLSSRIRDSYAMLKASEKLMELYKQGLIPKTYQDFELSLAGYVTGKVEAITVISRLKSLLDYETQYWGQVVEREKAIARIESITGKVDLSAPDTEKGMKGSEE